MRGYLAEVMAHFWAERAEGYAAGTAPPLGALTAAACVQAWSREAGGKQRLCLPTPHAVQPLPKVALLLHLTSGRPGGLPGHRAAAPALRRPTAHLQQAALRRRQRGAGGAPRPGAWSHCRRCRCERASCCCSCCAMRSICSTLPPYLPPQALASYTGRLAPRLALLSPELLDRHVVQRVLRWAELGQPQGGGGGGGLSELLAEDALEVRLLLAAARAHDCLQSPGQSTPCSTGQLRPAGGNHPPTLPAPDDLPACPQEERALSALTAAMQAELAARQAAGGQEGDGAEAEEGAGAAGVAAAAGQPAAVPGG